MEEFPSSRPLKFGEYNVYQLVPRKLRTQYLIFLSQSVVNVV